MFSSKTSQYIKFENSSDKMSSEMSSEISPKNLPEILPETLPDISPETLPETLPDISPETLPYVTYETLLSELFSSSKKYLPMSTSHVLPSEYSNYSKLYPKNNYSKSYPLTFNHSLPSHELDRIYSGVFSPPIPLCFICDFKTQQQCKVIVDYKYDHRICCTFDHLERIYYRNECYNCNIKWYNVIVSYCTECDGYLIDKCINHSLCKCVFPNFNVRAQKVKGKKCIIFDDNKLKLYEENDVYDYIKNKEISKQPELSGLDNKNMKEIDENNNLINNVSLEKSLKASLETSLKEKKVAKAVADKKSWWNYFNIFGFNKTLKEKND
jgi:hypothetical protein